MIARVRRGTGSALVAAVCLAVALGTPSAAGPSHPEDPVAGHQTSDRHPGERATAVSPRMLQRSARETHERTWRVRRGLTYRGWTRTDRRGPVRLHLLTATRRAVRRLDLLSGATVPQGQRVKAHVRRAGAVAGVNGDFFDIRDTGAPRGTGVARRAGVRHGRSVEWPTVFALDPNRRARIGDVGVDARVQQVPGLSVTHVNAPWIRPHGVGLYTEEWGTAPGRRVLDGAPDGAAVRRVVIRDGIVVENSEKLAEGEPIVGEVLLGRGNGAQALAEWLPVGVTATIEVSPSRPTRLAIGGDPVLLKRGRLMVEDDSILHPRTAVGIDRDGRRLLLLVVDGRSEESRGHTLVELARTMRRLGAEHALNLDGGGSTTMVVRHSRTRRLKVVNSPSDGGQRRVPNGLGFR